MECHNFATVWKTGIKETITGSTSVCFLQVNICEQPTLFISEAFEKGNFSRFFPASSSNLLYPYEPQHQNTLNGNGAPQWRCNFHEVNVH